MNYRQLTDEYIGSENKSRFVKQKAKEYGVSGSDIVCELLKSGYKFEELKRMSECQYKSAVNKLHKWQEEGCPATELIPVDQEENEESEQEEIKIIPETEGETVSEQIADNKYKFVSLESHKKVLLEMSREIAHLQEKNKEYIEKIQELHKENAEYREANDALYNSSALKTDEVADFREEVKKRDEKISELEKEIEFLNTDKDVDIEVIRDFDAQCKELSKRLEKAEQFILSRMVYGE